MPDRCHDHRPRTIGYLMWHERSERRIKQGMRQRRCPDCLLWFWHDEWGKHKGWDTAEIAPEEETTDAR
jgi:hypothetical protein